MKKVMFISILSAFILNGCSAVDEVQSTNNRIVWEHSGNLPAQKGFKQNIGTAGLLSGVLKDKYIVVGGGANFPYDTVLNNGVKKLYSDIYLLEDVEGELKVKNHLNLNNEIGYGASITTKEGVYYVGGAATQDADNDILFLSIKDDIFQIKKIGDLPFTFQNGGAVEKDGKLYILGGKQNGKATNKMYEYDLVKKEIKELPSIPGEQTRAQFVTQILNGELYIFSGGDAVAYTDGYKYNFDTKTWKKISDVEIGEKKISLLGASSIKLNEYEMLVIGGFDKEVYDNAVKNLGELKGDKLVKFREKYFRADPYEFNWNKEVLVYNAKENKWRTIGKIPFDAPCGEALVLIDNNIYSINGEIKPGVRTSQMFKGTLIK